MKDKLLKGILTGILSLAMAFGVATGILNGKAKPVYADYSEIYSATFTEVATHSYTQNKTFTLNEKGWKASVSQVNGGVFYLGCNSSNAAKGILNDNDDFSSVVTSLKNNDNIYNTNYATAHAYAMLFENSYNDVTKVSFSWDGGNNAFQVYLLGDSGSGFVLLNSTNYATSGASVSGSVEWTGIDTDFVKFAIVARPGTTSTAATNKTLRAKSFKIYETSNAPSTYTITYDANGGSGTMTDPNSPYNSGATVTILANAFTYNNHSFDRWNTQQDGLGTDYNAGQTFSISANTTLYAQWIDNSTYSVTYDSNGSTSGSVPNDETVYSNNESVIVLGNSGSLAKTGFIWSCWNTKADGTGTSYISGDSFEINSDVTLYAKWDNELGDLAGQTGTINFGNAAGSLNVNKTCVIGNDNVGVSWTVTTVPSPSGESFTASSTYSQIGASAKPASSILFETQDLQNDYKVTAFSAKFGGFSNTVGTITLNVGNQSVGTGSLDGVNDVTISKSSSVAIGSKLSVSVTGIDKGVKVYFISYVLAPAIETQTITASADSAYSDEEITLSTNADTATWSITDNAAQAELSTFNGKSTVVSANKAGSVTIQATSVGFTTVNKTVTFEERPAGTYYTITFDEDGGSNHPENKTILEGETFVFPSPGSKAHYSFLGWTSDLNTFYQTGDSSSAVNSDADYLAYWEEDDKFTISYTAGDNGTGLFADGNHYASTYTLLPFADLTGVVASNGYRFKNYTVGGINKNPGDTFELNSNTEVTVNFEVIPLEYVVTFGTNEASGSLSDFSNTSFIIPSGVLLDNIQGFVYSNNSNASAALRFGKKDAVGSIDVTIDNNYYIKKIVANLKYYSSDTEAKFAVTPYNGSAIEKTMTNSFANYEFDISSSCSNKATLGTTIESKRAFLSGFTIVYEEKTVEQKIETNIDTLSALKFTYNNDIADYDIKDAAIRFGGFISADLWDELQNVEGFGVITTATSSLGGESIKAKYNAKKEVFAADENLENDTVDAILTAICTDLNAKKASANNSNPATADNEQKVFMGVDQVDNYYVWTSRKDIDNNEIATQFTSVAYIKIDGDILFLQETTTSIKELALNRASSMDPSNNAYEAIVYITLNY